MGTRNDTQQRHSLSLFFVLVVSARLLGHVLALDASVAAAAEGRLVGEVDVLLGVQPDQEGGDVDDLLADADVALADQDTISTEKNSGF